MDRTADNHDRETLDFLLELTVDRDAGRQRSLLEYLARYPGREEAVAREYLQLQARGDERSTPDDERDVGPYRLIAELGRGGQGAVWLARDRRLGRDVALKVLHRGFSAATSPERFRREALVAAKLDHPGLATVFDAGEDGGQQWLAMRYVPGEPLAALLARHRSGGATAGKRCLRLPSVAADTSERDAITALVTLFAQAARALEIAHAAGVVHRDVKPGNLMITPTGTPVLVDFGLARDNDSSAACLTHTGEQLGTPAYMAPELLRPGLGGLGPAIDVWGLAIALYETLTGSHPFAASTRQAMQVAICAAEPPPLRQLNPAAPRSLVTVLEVALQKDPRRRHGSAGAFALDLELLAAGEAPLCRPPSAPARLAMWSRRHPAMSVALTLLALFAGVAIAYLDHAWRVESNLRAQVTTRAGELRRLARGLLFESYRTVRDLPGAMLVNRELSTRALEYLQLLRAEATDDPDLLADVVMALLQVGDVLGNPRQANLGRPDEARERYVEALNLLDAAGARAMARPELLRAQCLLRLGELDESGHDTDSALRRWSAALQLLPRTPGDATDAELRATLNLRCGETALWTTTGTASRDAAAAALQLALTAANSHPDAPTMHRLAAAVHAATARLALDAGDNPQAASAADAAFAALAQLPSGQEYHLSVRCLRAIAEGVRGTLDWRAGNAEDACRRLRTAGDALTELGELDPDNEQVARFRLQTCGTLALVLIDQEQHTECEQVLQQAMALVEAGAARFGADWFEEQRAATLLCLGQLRYHARDLEQARTLMQQVVDIHRTRAFAHPGDRRIAGQLALAELRLGWTLVRSNQGERGRAAIDAASASLTALLTHDPTVVIWRKGLATAQQQLAEIAFQAYDFDAAASRFEAAIEVQRGLPAGPENDRGLAILHQGRGECRLQLRDVAGACSDGDAAVAMLRRANLAAPQDRFVERLLANALVTLARFRHFHADAGATAAADEALAIVDRLLDGNDDTPKLLQTRAMAMVMQAALHLDAGRRDEAITALRAARQTLTRLPTGRQQLPGTFGLIQQRLERQLDLVETGR